MSCRHMSSSYTIFRRNMVTSALRNVCKRAGLCSTREPLCTQLDLTPHKLAKPVGTSMLFSTPALVPLSLTPLSPMYNHTPHPPPQPQPALRKQRRFAQYRLNGLISYPFAIETMDMLTSACQ